MKGGYQWWCKTCWKAVTDKRRNGPKRHIELRQRQNRHLVRTFGITIEDYDSMLAKQNGGCYICYKTKDSNKRLAVDHDAITGKIRGILCENCNRAIGQLAHDINRLQRAITYLTL